MKVTRGAHRTNPSARWGRKGFSLIEIMIVVSIHSILLAIAVPNFMKARESSYAKSCVANLKQIRDAKLQWALDHHQPGTATPTAADLYGGSGYIKREPKCPFTAGSYTIGTVDAKPRCLFESTDSRHALP
jgi:prepilin-type N-terminal cleavage/methylation domain-containing protein